MENKNLTALISCFARAYHYKNSINPILKDDIATKILLKEEYVVNDIYMIDENVNISNMSYLDILKKYGFEWRVYL